MQKQSVAILATATILLAHSGFAAEPSPRELLEKSKKVLILGDSITYAGQYVAYFDTWLLGKYGADKPTVINCGLPSETVSGLSEEGHADGKFPRPHLAERLDRVLNFTGPDLVIACYGINCGIYQPFDEARLRRYQLGMEVLKVKVQKKLDAHFIAVTPPFYDDQRSPQPFSYNEVLDRYSQWLVDQREYGWSVIDLHSPMTAEVKKRRAADENFTFQPDGVHPNDAGHWFIAQQLITAFGDERASEWSTPQEMVRGLELPEAVLPLVQQRMAIMRDAYLTAAGHKRPGMAKGLSLQDAHQKAAELTTKIKELTAQ